MNSKIIPHLWFDTEAQEAAEFYVSLFENSKIKNGSQVHGTPSGSTQIVDFILAGTHFQAISAGPYFKFNTAISLMVYCTSKAEALGLWNKLKQDAHIIWDLAPDKYNLCHGVLSDKYGLSWQILASLDFSSQQIVPNLSFSGQAQEAMAYYGQVFSNSYIKSIDLNEDSSIMHAEFKIEDLLLTSRDDKASPSFNEAFSFMIMCSNQEEINFYWYILSDDPKAEQCGWLKDKFGLSWQIVPKVLPEMLRLGNKQQKNAVTQAFLSMKKLDIKTLEKAYIDNAQ